VCLDETIAWEQKQFHGQLTRSTSAAKWSGGKYCLEHLCVCFRKCAKTEHHSFFGCVSSRSCFHASFATFLNSMTCAQSNEWGSSQFDLCYLRSAIFVIITHPSVLISHANACRRPCFYWSSQLHLIVLSLFCFDACSGVIWDHWVPVNVPWNPVHS